LGEGKKRTQKSQQLVAMNRFFSIILGSCLYQCTIKGGREGRDVDAMDWQRLVKNWGQEKFS